ncbi:cytochrome C assembly family protein [Flindersiella endophytica]
MNTLLAGWSDNFMYAATAVFVLAFLAHAGEWAFTRERRTAQVAATKVRAMQAKVAASVGAGAPADPIADSIASSDTATVAGSAEEPDPEAKAAWNQQYRVDQFSRIGIGLTILGTLLLGLGVVCRGFAAGRVPWSNMYEFATTGTFIIALAYVVLMPRFKFTWLGLPLTGFALVVMGISLVWLYTPVAGLIPALQSYWLVIHVSAAVTATGVFTIGALTSVLQLVKARYERRLIAGKAEAGSGYLSRLPSAEAIDRVAYRLHAFAFPIWTFALIAGAIWAAEAWGRYWGWDPKETWMFITWVSYAAYLHARSTAGWRNKVSWVSLVAYGALLFNLIGVNVFLSGLHSYAGI